MSREPIFPQVGEKLVERLRQEMVPAVLSHGDDVKLTHPGADRDYRFGVFLYDVEETRPYGVPAPVRRSDAERGYPDRLLALRFLLFANRRAPFDSVGAVEELTLLEAAIRALHSAPPLEVDGQRARAEFYEPARSEKTALWQSLGCPLQSAVYLTVEPVAISSERVRRVPPVREVEVSAKRKEGKGR